jgi:putative membrane protein
LRIAWQKQRKRNPSARFDAIKAACRNGSRESATRCATLRIETTLRKLAEAFLSRLPRWSKIPIFSERKEEKRMTKWWKQDKLLAAAALLAGTCALAQMPGSSGQTPGNQQQQQPTPQGQPSQTMPSTGTPDNSQSFGDMDFLHKTLEDNLAQEQMGQLAQQKSQSDDVKQFGEKMAQIHEQLTDQIMPEAKKLGVDEPKQPSKKDRQEIEKMQSLSGSDFDAAFIRAMMKDQQDDLKGFKNEAESSHDPNMQQLARMDEPVLSQHLQVLQQLAQTHNVSAESQK